MDPGRTKQLLSGTLLLLFLFSLGVPALSFVADDVSASGGGTRHQYTFSDGSTEAIAIYHMGTPARNVKVTLPRGAEVTDVEMTIAGASSTGWNQIVHQSRSDWESGEATDVETRSDELTLAMDSPVKEFVPHSMHDNASSGSAWNDNGSFSIRQPHTSNSTETRLSAQRTLTSSVGSYNGAVMKHRGWLYVSTFDSKQIDQVVKKVWPNNLSVHSSVKIDPGNCAFPYMSTWGEYGFRGWTVGDDERLYAILGSDTYNYQAQYLRLWVLDIRYENNWECIQSYDLAGQQFGSYTGISFDRSRDLFWVLHPTRRTILPYSFSDDGTFERDGSLQYGYFSNYNQQHGLAVENSLFFMRSRFQYYQDKIEVYAISGTSTTLAKQTGEASIPANGYGIYNDGQRLLTLDHYHWSNRYYREYGTGWSYPIAPQPGTSNWVSPPINTNSDVLVANIETVWSATAAGDRVDHWVSADNGTHWVQVVNNQTVHFAHPGQQLRWKLQMVGSTSVSWWMSINYSTDYNTAGSWTSPTITTSTQVGQMQVSWVASTPSGTTVGVEVSNDNGSNWQTVTNNQMVTFTSQGNQLVYRVTFGSTDSSVTPTLSSFTLDYEEGYPSSVRLDIGDDGSYEYVGTDLLNQPVTLSGQNLVDAFNDNILDNGVGVSNVTLTFLAGSPGRIRVSDLDVTYKMSTMALDASLEGGMLVPDGATRVLVARVVEGDEADRINQVDVELQATGVENPIIRWSNGDVCSLVSDNADLISFDAANCTSQESSDGVLSLLLPLRSNWTWDDESGIEVLLTVDDDIGRQVTRWETENLGMRVENDIQLMDLGVEDETGRVLFGNDWVRGGLEVTFHGSISFEGTAYSPQAGQFSLELTGQNLTMDGDPMEPEKQFHIEPNPSHGQYSITIISPIESSPGGMLFRVKAVGLVNNSQFVNPGWNTVRLVLDGNSPLVIGASPADGDEVHKGTPSQPIRIVVQDSVDPPTQLDLRYWVEGQHDLDYDGVPDWNEYNYLTMNTPEVQPGGLNIFEGLIQDHMNQHGEKVSLYIEGTDAQGNALAMGGGPVCPEEADPCGGGFNEQEPDWDADLVTYRIREEFEPYLESENSTIVGHGDEAPLHPGTQYIARLRVVDRNGWNDISTVQISLTGELSESESSIWANFTKLEDGTLDMYLESGGPGLAVSNLYSDYTLVEGNESILDLNIRFQLTWLFPEEMDTDGESTYVPVIEVSDWPCYQDVQEPCFSERGGLGNDEWSLDNDLRFDLDPGHFTAIDLATGQNLYNEEGEQRTIAAGQVVRVNGRILFSEDHTPAPEGAFDIVVGNLELQWRAVPREGGEFTVDILVPNVRSGHLDMYAWLENLPGLATDQTPEPPRILLEVDGVLPLINSILPSGDIPLSDAGAIAVFLNTSDASGFDPDRPAVLHYVVRAGESEVTRGSYELRTLLQQYGYGHWTDIIDITDGGVTELLPGYLVDVWVTGADAAGNPYVSENNTEATPLETWRLVRIGPSVDLFETDISWSDATPESGDRVTLTIIGTNTNDEEGNLTFALQRKIGNGVWVDVEDAWTEVTLRPQAGFIGEIIIDTEEVEEETVERYRLVVRDGHVVLDRISIDPLILQPPVARDAAAISQQFTENMGTILLYFFLMVSLIVIVVLIVMNRDLGRSEPEGSTHDQTVDVIADMSAPPPPPEGFDTDAPPPEKAPAPPEGFDPNSLPVGATPPPPPSSGTSPDADDAGAQSSSQGWTDIQLLAQGWTHEQVDAWKVQQQEGKAALAKMKFSEAVLERAMTEHGITDREAFLTYAVAFDAEGNNYLNTDELERAARWFTGKGDE